MPDSLDRIERFVELEAPLSRVWKAVTDHNEFGEWFRVKIDSPFAVGKASTGHITYPGYEHLKWEVAVQKIEPERLFSFTWHPYAVDPKADYSKEPPTLVEFHFENIPTGTRLTIIESGFEKIPPGRRAEAFRMNEGGWAEQMRNIETYLSPTP